MTNAYRDENNVPTIIGVSSVDGVTPVRWKIDPTTGRGLVDLAGGTGSVTSVSVVSANGFAGTVANATTTPAITLTTTVTGILKGNGTSISAATDGTDYLSSTTGVTLAQSSAQTIGTTTNRVLKLWATDITVTNAISGSITGNASTVTTNANLTGAITSVGNATSLGSFSSANLASAVTDETGSGALVFATSPTLVTPLLGTPTSGTLTNCTGLPISSGVSGLGTGIATFLATPSSANLISAVIDETGTGALVFGTSPTLTTPTVTTKISPTSDDGAPLGDTTHNFSDLFLASGAVINFANSNVTVTHSSGLLTVSSPVSLGTSNAFTTGTIELGAASDTTLSRSSAGVLAVEGVVIPSISSTNTLTNKRITKRNDTVASSATPTINTDNVDFFSITALAVAITSFTTNLSGTPTEAQTLWIAITDNGSARSITWGTSFESSTVTLPTVTVVSTRLDIGFIWNTVTSKWRCVAVA